MPYVRILASGMSLALFGAVGFDMTSIGAELPVPCATGSCGAAGPKVWVSAGSAGLVQVGNLMTITQNSEDAIFNWRSFNISSDGRRVGDWGRSQA